MRRPQPTASKLTNGLMSRLPPQILKSGESDDRQGVSACRHLGPVPVLALSVEPACVSVARITGEKMKSDSDIKRDAEAELKWDPHIDASDIAVAVKDGVVTLIGLCLHPHHT